MMYGTSEPVRDGPRIVVDNSEYWLSNLGDLAMLDVTLRRIVERCPGARIGVLTDSPALLRAYFPQAEGIDATGDHAWSDPGLVSHVCAALGPRVIGPLVIARLRFRSWLPAKARGARRRLLRLLAARGLTTRDPDSRTDTDSPAVRALPVNSVRAVDSGSLLLAMGGSYVTDTDQAQSYRTLNLLDHAHRRGIPTAMVGQGLGPLEDPDLVERFATVMPRVGLVGLREARTGPELLFRAGVAEQRVVVSGDDAIELSYSERRETIGSGIGVCLRVAGYSPVSAGAQARLREALHAASDRHAADLIPLIIAEYRSQDRRSTLPLTRSSARGVRPLDRFARPQDLCAQVSRCRVVVTGAYHAAVFALAQGIPVLALSTSRLYDDKFLGLQGMFGGGLDLHRLEEHLDSDQLKEALARAWDQAPAGRARLLVRAEEQIAASNRVFDQVLAPLIVRSG